MSCFFLCLRCSAIRNLFQRILSTQHTWYGGVPEVALGLLQHEHFLLVVSPAEQLALPQHELVPLLQQLAADHAHETLHVVHLGLGAHHQFVR